MSDLLQRLLKLRPTNAAMRLGPSLLPLLSPRDLLRALSAERSALLCAPLFSRAAMAGVLAGARQQGAVVGLAIPFPLGERDRPEAFLDELLRLEALVPHTRPVFLQAGPFPVRAADERTLELLSAQVFRYLEAGCSLLSFDASALEPRAAARAYARLAQPAVERELPVELAALRDERGAPLAEQTHRLLQTLKGFSLAPLLLSVELAGLLEPDGQLQLGRFEELAAIAREFGAQLSVRDPERSSSALYRQCVQGGCRKLEAVGAFARLTGPALPPGALDALHRRAAESNRPWTELLGALSEGLAHPDEAARTRLEAVAWDEAVALLDALGARGSATRAARFLAEQAGY